MRKLDPDLIIQMRASIVDSEDFQFAKKQGLWRPAMTTCSIPWVGVKELENDNRGASVDMIGLTVDGKHTGEAYCLAWVQTIIAFVELELRLTSPLKATEGCIDLWNSTSKYLKFKSNPQPGDIAIWKHGNGPSGHAGIVMAAKENYFETIEANVIASDGVTHGICGKLRLFNDDSNMKLLGFIKPF